jgi:hypothetical protein
MIFTLFGIRNKKTKQPMGYRIFSNEGGEFCNSVGAQLILTCQYDPIWLVGTREEVERTLAEDSEWYNASLEHPQWPVHNWDNSEYEVFVSHLTIP